ncbi:MAG TPA: hypothetical protein VMZ53_00265, partial [Kofleriaceae bacterium]|nr:hypothetical protein [Kofleriaceae bacterium]
MKLAASIEPPRSAARHSSEFAANPIIAEAVSSAVRPGPFRDGASAAAPFIVDGGYTASDGRDHDSRRA